MSDYKISGACTLCDEMCFEVLARWSENERYPGEPKRLGPPVDGATLITFVLFDGTKADLTFCGNCAASLTPESYVEIWRKVIRSWQREMSKGTGDQNPDWYQKQFANGILGEMGRTNWKDKNG